ncbi:MAG: hypothetical protein ACRDTF_03275 [Pseudonocardiaceae bacterium]
MSTRKAVGTSAHVAPIAWLHLRGDPNNPEGYTIRWRRGETVAYVLVGKQLDSHAITGVLTTVDVPLHGWIDFNHVRAHGRRWLTTHIGRGSGR